MKVGDAVKYKKSQLDKDFRIGIIIEKRDAAFDSNVTIFSVMDQTGKILEKTNKCWRPDEVQGLEVISENA